MSNKKHIDRLFQERFKDFEATPSDAVWKHIEAELNKKKKKRRIIPIWWRYAGVAALLLLLLTIGNLFFNNSEDIPAHQVVDTEDVNPVKINTDNNSPIDSNKDNKNKVIDNNTETVAESNTEKPEILEKGSGSKTDGGLKNIAPSNETSVAENTASKQKNKGAHQAHPPSKNILNNPNTVLKTENNIAVVSVSNSKEKNNEALQNKKELHQIDLNKADETINNISKNNNAIAEVDTNEILTDSIPAEVIANNTKENTRTIEDALNEDTIEEEKDEKLNRWSIAPNAAPVYFSSLGNGSSIDPQFNNNSKSGELNMSYGIKASYAINKKLSVRTGVNKVNLGYNTNNVVVFQSLSAKSSSLQNVKSVNNNTAEDVSIISSANLNSSISPEAFSRNSNTSINQNMGYIEVPLEIQYALTNKKLGVNLIGGFSSFFLNKNEIFSESTDSKVFLGEASNINKVSYSANFGLGLNYKFSKKIDLNLEPMFKYQINTFNNTSGDFKPYFIGVYTGFAIKF